MASISATSNKYTLTLTVTEGSQSVTNNTTTVDWSLVMKANGYNYKNSNTTDNFKVSINGTQVLNSNKAMWFSTTTSSVTVASGSTTIKHNSDGTKTGMAISFSFTPGRTASYYPESMSKSGTMNLTTIPRAATISSISCSTTYLSGSISVGYDCKNTSFTHYVRFSVGTTQIYRNVISTSATGAQTCTHAFNASQLATIYNLIPNSETATVSAVIETYTGSTKVGESSAKTISLTVPNNVVPSVSSVVISEATSNLATKFAGYVQNKSTLKIDISASASYSSISSYKTTIDGVTYYGPTVTTSTVKTSGTVPVSVTVTDGRGRTATYSGSITVYEYFDPKITSFSVDRCLSDGTVDDSGSYARFTFTSAIASVNSKNTKSTKLQYLNGSTWTDITTFTDAYSYSEKTYTTTSGLFSTDSMYQVRLVVTDYFSSTNNMREIATEFTLINFNASGAGLAFGKVSSGDFFEANMPIYDRFGTSIGNGLAAYTGSTDAAIDPDTTLEQLVLTNKNTPTTAFYFVITMFYNAKSETSNKAQIAVPYNSNARSMYHRYMANGAWSSWQRYNNFIADSAGTEDPDTTVEPMILTNVNTPMGSGYYMYIQTVFQGTPSATGSRSQTAIPYNRIGSVYHRYYSSSGWSEWRRHINADEISAYPIESGTSGIWNYTKWSDGTAECWGNTTTSSVNITQAFGGVYRSTTTFKQSFPFTFADIPYCNVSVGSSGDWAIWEISRYRASTTTTKEIYVGRPSSNSGVSVTFSWYAKGKLA